jgi:hypothetical protein
MLIARAVPPEAEPLTLQFLGQVSGMGTTLVQNETSSSSNDQTAARGEAEREETITISLSRQTDFRGEACS